MAQFNFNAAEHAGAQMNFEALPKGWYQAKLIESKVRQTNSGGQALDFVAEILAPAFAKGRKVFLGFNVVHPTSEDAVRIGFEQLASLSMAVQTPQWQQTEQLHEKPFHIKLKIEKAPEGSDYEDRNQPNGYDMITTQRALAVQPGTPAGAPTSAPFPGAVAPAPAPAAAPTAPVAPPVQPAAVAPQAAPAAPAAPAQAQPWNQPQPWEAPANAAAPAAPQQPAPVQAAPAPVEPQKSPEQLAWEAQQAAVAQQPAQAPVAPAAPAQEAPAPWATQTATPAPQQPQAPQAPAAPVEPPHPAQAQVPPWQQPTA